jgi:hypothetical protein
MTDLTSDILPIIKGHHLPIFPKGAEFISPHYDGLSILNLASGICQLLGVPEIQPRSLNPTLLAPFGDEIRRVILVLIDALAFHRLQRWLADGTAPIWGSMLDNGVLAPLTSAVPSTTSTCLPTIWSGLSPAEHGMIGYELWLKEYGVVANMIRHTPFMIGRPGGSLEMAGFQPELALSTLTLGTHLREQGIPAYAFQPYDIVSSGLSRMFLKDVAIQPYGTSSDLWISMRNHLEEIADERAFIWAYWSELDFNGHNYGPDHERCVAEFANFSASFEQHFLSQLSPKARDGTLLILTADHGQIHTAKDMHYDLKSHPNLARRLHINPTGENRILYFFIRPGQTEAVSEYLDRTFMHQFLQLNPAFAAEAGLFGPGTPSPRLGERTGDLIALAKSNAYLWWGEKPNPIYGRHGGLSAEEMLVPFLAVRL